MQFESRFIREAQHAIPQTLRPRSRKSLSPAMARPRRPAGPAPAPSVSEFGAPRASSRCVPRDHKLGQSSWPSQQGLAAAQSAALGLSHGQHPPDEPRRPLPARQRVSKRAYAPDAAASPPRPRLFGCACWRRCRGGLLRARAAASSPQEPRGAIGLHGRGAPHLGEAALVCGPQHAGRALGPGGAGVTASLARLAHLAR